MTVTDFVYNSNMCQFRRYFDGNLIYEVARRNSSDVYEFCIPVGIETKGAAFLDVEKSINLMRWIRQSIEDKTINKVSSGAELEKTPIEVKD
jgi:hypothetical protein